MDWTDFIPPIIFASMMVVVIGTLIILGTLEVGRGTQQPQLPQRCTAGITEVFVEQPDGTAAWYPVQGPRCAETVDSGR